MKIAFEVFEKLFTSLYPEIYLFAVPSIQCEKMASLTQMGLN